MKPILKYSGGKTKEIPSFQPYLPKTYSTYYEPFFGGGALFFHLEPKNAVVNDVNEKLTSFYQYAASHYDDLRAELNGIQYEYERNRAEFDKRRLLNPQDRVTDANEALYYAMRDMYNNKGEKKYSDAAVYFFINKTAYSGMTRYNRQGEFNVPYGRYKNLNTQLLTKAHSDLLSGTDINNGDYAAIFDKMTCDDFMFLDPPYDCVFSDYGNTEFTGGFDEDHHRRLATDFRNLSGKAMMVIGSTPLIEGLYHNFIKARYDKVYGVNIKNRFKATSEHLIITNY